MVGAQPLLQSCGAVEDELPFFEPKVHSQYPIVAPALQSHLIERFSLPPAQEYCS